MQQVEYGAILLPAHNSRRALTSLVATQKRIEFGGIQALQPSLVYSMYRAVRSATASP